MTRTLAATVFLLASLTAPAMTAGIDIGFDCAEGSDEDIVAPQQAMSLSLLKFVGQASLVDDAMLPS